MPATPSVADANQRRPLSTAAMADAISSTLGPSTNDSRTDPNSPWFHRQAVHSARPRGVETGIHRVSNHASSSQHRTFCSAYAWRIHAGSPESQRVRRPTEQNPARAIRRRVERPIDRRILQQRFDRELRVELTVVAARCRSDDGARPGLPAARSRAADRSRSAP